MISVIGGELYQWDTGRQVQITSKKNYTIDEVHFCNEDSESALVCQATVEDSVATAFIPNILLHTSKDLIVYAVITTDDDRRTVERNTFRVFERKRPDDYVYTETEVFSYKALEDRVKKLEESSIDAEAIATAVSEYMKENPISIPDEYVTDEEIEKKGFALKSELPTIPVQSVNGKTGDVSLGAEDVGARPNTWTPTASDVGADSVGTAQTKVDEHNVNTESHNDIRLLIEGLTTRLNALADSDDITLDQLSEVVAYIKSNKSLIDAITTNKISYTDIVDNLTTNISNKPLSAAQGVVLKTLIDGIIVPTLLSQLEEDATHRTVTDEEKKTWNAKSEFSGNYDDLSGKPELGSIYSSTEERAIGTWIDGKTIYRKTIVYTVNPLPASKWAYYKEADLAALNIDQYVNMSGIALCYSTKATEIPLWQPIPRVCPDAVAEYSIGFGDLKSEQIGVLFGTEYTGATIYFTIEYTKVEE